MLTYRQLEVLATIADMGTFESTADVLGISPHTVEQHIRNARLILGVHTTVQAAAAVARYEALHDMRLSRASRRACTIGTSPE